MNYLDDDNFYELINKGLHLVVFYTDWCGGCTLMNPTLNDNSDKIDVIKVNDDKYKDLSKYYEINTLPYLLFFKDGKLIERFPGFHTRENTIKKLDEILKNP